MSTNITKVSVIGTGVIGAGWVIRAIAHNKKVTAFDKDQKQEKTENVDISKIIIDSSKCLIPFSS